MNITLSLHAAKELLSAAIPQKVPIFIVGKPGCGKTSLVHEVAKELQYRLMLCTPVTSGPEDFKGLPFVVNASVEKKADFLPFGDLYQMIHATEPTLVLIDDLGQSNTSVQASLMHLVLAREVAGHKISDQVSFVACSNRKADRAGVSSVIEPLKSRFLTIVELEPLASEFYALANRLGFASELISFLMYRPELINDFQPTAELTNSPSQRTAEHVSQILEMQLSQQTEFVAIAGAAGEGFAAEFKGYLEIYRNLPDLGNIILNPTEAEVPKDPAVLYALTGALANKTSATNFDPIMQYVTRIPVEFQVVYVRNALQRKGSAITNSKTYLDWIIKHQDVFFS